MNGSSADGYKLIRPHFLVFIHFHYKIPAPRHPRESSSGPTPSWLAELQEFRGEILFPAAAPEARVDRDAYDGLCHHVLARQRGRLIGCVRLSRSLTPEERRAYIHGLGMDAYAARLPAFPGRAAVCGRWVVDPGARSLEVSYRLVAAALALARALGYSHLLSVAGTKTGQDRILLRSGASPLEGFVPVDSARFGEPVRILMHRPFFLPRNIQGLLDQMETLLGLATRDHYAMFLREEYFNTSDNPESFAMAAFHLRGPRRAMTREILRHALAESGHNLLALDDLEALGFRVRESLPAQRALPTTAAFNAYFVHQIQHGNPLTYLAYLYHLESIAAEAGPSVGAFFREIGIPAEAMTFLTEHADSDPAHVKWNEAYLTRLVTTPQDLSDVLHGIRAAGRLHGLMLEGIVEAVESDEPEWSELQLHRAARPIFGSPNRRLQPEAAEVSGADGSHFEDTARNPRFPRTASPGPRSL